MSDETKLILIKVGVLVSAIAAGAAIGTAIAAAANKIAERM